MTIPIPLQRRVKTLRKNKMNVGEKQINTKNQKTAMPLGKADSSLKKTKPEISNSFFQRIISLLKKEELI
ncbi:hypothetical protein SAMN05216324_11296 [Chryseobacterium limigenitum]|uniref:Uncharacterized protein n=1 Tax=Chryseobacterium limigenitum TaxID=1612149 RepID=A0A1K2ITT8_9FLAO|nr:hypothetical protein SAMN05216324_11296 [Chryseobacterium limigenitum]